jgi:hypothetical protein
MKQESKLEKQHMHEPGLVLIKNIGRHWHEKRSSKSGRKKHQKSKHGRRRKMPPGSASRLHNSKKLRITVSSWNKRSVKRSV